VKALLVEHALARGEPTETVRRAQEVMLEPHPGGVHDDHIHIRTACSAEEIVAGCVPNGPARPWLASAPALETSGAADAHEARDGRAPDADADLVRALLEPSPAPLATYAALPARGDEPVP